MKIAFRVDASVQIGTGHVMRCLTLAKALRERGAECMFVCRDHESSLNELLHSQGFVVHALPPCEEPPHRNNQPTLAHAHWLETSWHTDAQQTIEALGDGAVDWLIVDHYALDKRWESELRPHAKKIMVIDDLADREHDCDLLLDQNLVANFENRYDHLVASSCTRLLGPKYAILQPEYAEMRLRTPPRISPVSRIFVYFGGSDIYNLTELAVSAFLNLQHKGLQLDVVISPNSPNADSVRSQVTGHANITLHESMPSLAPLMAKADLAIGACGATTWERCCLGLPAIVVSVAKNQTAVADSLQRANLILWLGGAEQLSIEMLRDAITQATANEDIESWSGLCRGVVDGGGTNRVASAITIKPNVSLTARTAVAADEKLLLNWVNDSLVRENSFEQSRITAETHYAWFLSRLEADDQVRIYIVETEDLLPVGQVRFELDNFSWEIHFSIANFARGMGLGAKLLNTAIKEFRIAAADASLVGRVKTNNHASAGVFRKLGFQQMQGTDCLIFTYAVSQPVCT